MGIWNPGEGDRMEKQSLYFDSPGKVCIREEAIPEPGPGQVSVRSLLSAISPGTEMLIYRGQFPHDLPVDETIPSLAGNFRYPLKYGYSIAGVVDRIGAHTDPSWEGRHVFAFHPHESAFLALPQELIPIPEGLPLEEAIFLPNMETAVNFVLDGAPLIGEQVTVLGQGIVGLLTTCLLSAFPLERLVSLDRFLLRRQASVEAGAGASLDPDLPEVGDQLQVLLPEGADLAFELSGAPSALDQAISLTRFNGRIVVGSWYGQKRANLDLGGRFHRSRIRLISSQVSSIAPELSGRWSKERRLGTAWRMLEKIRPSRWITHHYTLPQAEDAYRLLDRSPEKAIQVVFTYG